MNWHFHVLHNFNWIGLLDFDWVGFWDGTEREMR